ncbi:MAG TPA: hypothetical protein VF739_12790, partial [Ktedonobacterales bacterium]
MGEAVPYYTIIVETGIAMANQDETLVGLNWRVPARIFVRGGIPRQQVVRLPLPGAKYYTLRYLLAALLADGVSLVRNPARSDDTVALVRALRALGADVSEAQGDGDWALRITGTGGRLSQPPDNTLAVGNAGAVLRLLLGISALLPAITFTTDHPQSLGRRPNADLLAALTQLGITADAHGPDGLLPITLRGGPPTGGEVTVSGARSSQYLSALLYLAPLLPQGLRITVTDGLRSSDLVRATLRVLAEAGIHVEAAHDLRAFAVARGQAYRAHDVTVPGDAPSAAALAVAASLLGQTAQLSSLDATQPESAALLTALETLGVPPTLAGGVLTIGTGASLHRARLDGDPLIDSVPALVAAAC